MRRKSISLSFFDPSATFFKSEWTHIFWARPLKIVHGFFQPFYCVFEAFLKKRMALPIWKSCMTCWRKSRNFNIKINLIELYVIKTWWKIKFKKRKVYHQLAFFSFFFSQTSTKHLDKLDYVVTELLLRKKIKCDQHNAASLLYFFFKPIINNLKSFISGTSEVVFYIFFLLEHHRLEDVFLGAPSEDRPQQTECMWRMLSRSSFGNFFWLRSWRNAYRRWLRLENNSKFWR